VLERQYEASLKALKSETSEEEIELLIATQQKVRKKISLVSKELGRIILR
jgi:adenosyl cobinamide kinase/adenosyl cobinamide phosphate guanylyltransferase